MINNEAIVKFFSETFLFRGLTAEQISAAVDGFGFTVCEFNKGDTIYSPDEFKNEIGFVFSGECTVCRTRNNGQPLPLNTLHRSDTFGITAVFSNDEAFPTVIYAKKATKVVFIDKKTLLSIIESSSFIAINVITFLTNRIEFLNRKIATLSSCGTDERLARLLLAESERHDGASFVLNCKNAAEGLGIGRASLYRGIKSLTKCGYIEYANKKIYIKDPKGLEGISK